MANIKARKVHKFDFKPFSQKQLRVLNWWSENSPVKDRRMMIADGSIRAGKTLAITLSFILFVMKNYNNQNAAIAGKSVGAVRRNIVPNMLSMLLSLGFDYVDHRSDNYIEIIKGDTVNNVYLFGLKDATSASHIQGLTLASAFVDECVIADREGFNQLLGRCSVDGSKIFCSCNPESPYHWFYTDFIKQAKKKNILYIHFNMDDNPSLSEEIKEEYKRMFSGVWASRFIDGQWVTANGLVYDMFNDDTHIIDFNDIPFEEAQKWCLGIDYGTANPTAALLCFKTYDGDIYVVDEYYHAGGQLKGMEDDDDFDNVTGYEEQKTDLEYTSDMRMFLTDHQGFTSLTWRQLDTVIDPAAASFCLQMRKMGMRVKHANNSVLDGIRTVATYLGNNRLFICDKCTNLISEMHNYSWDEKAQLKGIDQVVKQHDHAQDALRYSVMYLKDKRDVSRAAINVGYW